MDVQSILVGQTKKNFRWCVVKKKITFAKYPRIDSDGTSYAKPR